MNQQLKRGDLDTKAAAKDNCKIDNDFIVNKVAELNNRSKGVFSLLGEVAGKEGMQQGLNTLGSR